MSAQDQVESDAASEEESDHEQDATPRRSNRKRNCIQVRKDSDEHVSLTAFAPSLEATQQHQMTLQVHAPAC